MKIKWEKGQSLERALPPYKHAGSKRQSICGDKYVVGDVELAKLGRKLIRDDYITLDSVPDLGINSP